MTQTLSPSGTATTTLRLERNGSYAYTVALAPDRRRADQGAWQAASGTFSLMPDKCTLQEPGQAPKDLQPCDVATFKYRVDGSRLMLGIEAGGPEQVLSRKS